MKVDFASDDDTVLVVDPSHAGTRLDVFITGRMSQLSRSRVQKLIETGNILVSGTTKPAKYVLRAGEEILVRMPPIGEAVPKAESIDIEVTYEDAHLLVINKPPGLVVHPGAGVQEGTLVNALLGRPGAVSSIGGVQRPGIVHRLDKDTSGLMLVAKTDACHIALSRALADHTIRRVYHCIALRSFSTRTGTIHAPIGRHLTQRTKMAVHERQGSRQAVTHWRVLEPFYGMSLVECRLETGRTHQIRVHLAHEKHPVLGDEVYGGTVSLALQLVSGRSSSLRAAVKLVGRQMLHAKKLQFMHPITSKELSFEVEEPEDFRHVLIALRADAANGETRRA